MLFSSATVLNSTQQVVQCLACGSRDHEPEVTTDVMMGQKGLEWYFVRCKDCSLVFLNPQVVPAALHTFYTESYLPYQGAAAWGRYRFFVEWDQKSIDRKRVNTVCKYIGNKEFSTLDIGCGKPTFLAQLKKSITGRAIGIDFSDKGWIGLDSFAAIDLQVGEVANLVLDATVDVITMWHYIEHDYDPYMTLTNLLQHSHAHTRLVIEVPHHDSYTRYKYGKFWAGYHSPRHTALYTPDTMDILLRRAGWKVIDKYEYGTLDPYTLDWMSRMEQECINWSVSMENRFVNFLLGKLLRPRYFFPRRKSLGFMTVVAEPA